MRLSQQGTSQQTAGSTETLVLPLCSTRPPQQQTLSRCKYFTSPAGLLSVFCCCYGSAPSRRGLIIVRVPGNERARGATRSSRWHCTSPCPRPCSLVVKGREAGCEARTEKRVFIPLPLQGSNTARFSLVWEKAWLGLQKFVGQAQQFDPLV